MLSEDVDTLMFGCGMTLRNWTAEGARGNKSPTHVNVYNAEATKATAGLDVEGMILVALMSGGDYIPAGIPGCGPKTACEAAKAGFGWELCSIKRGDADGFSDWRERLQLELQTNESKLFRQRHKSMTIPESFPDLTVLGYYLRPAVSSVEKINKLKEEIKWDGGVNIADLRLFVVDAFNWPYLIGAKKFIRGLAPALLAHKLTRKGLSYIADEKCLEAKASSESQVVKAICGRRSHWNTDGTPELKVAYIPNEIVGLDLDAEEDEDIEGYGQDVSEDEQPASGGEDDRDRSRSPAKRRGPSTYDPSEVKKIWVLETYVKLGVPLLVETWEEDMRNPSKFASRKAREKKTLSKAKDGTKSGAMDQFVRISKPGVRKPMASQDSLKQAENPSLPPVFLAPATASLPCSPRKIASSAIVKSIGQRASKKGVEKAQFSKTKSKGKPAESHVPLSSPNESTSNPWTLSRRPSDTLRFKSPTRYSALGIYVPGDPEYEDSSKEHFTANKEEKYPSLASPPSSPTPRKRRSRPTTPISDADNNQESSQNRAPRTGSTPQKSIGLATPSTQNSSKPSPRKKRSPLEMANELYVAGQLKAPTSIRRERNVHPSAVGEVEQLTAKNVNRKIDFTEHQDAHEAASPASDTDSLPSPSTLLSPSGRKEGYVPIVQPVSFERESVSPSKEEKARRFVALRESLEGAWRLLEPWEVEMGTKKNVYSRVEVVDLSGG